MVGEKGWEAARLVGIAGERGSCKLTAPKIWEAGRTNLPGRGTVSAI